MAEYIPFNPNIPPTYKERVEYYFYVYQNTFPDIEMLEQARACSKGNLIKRARKHCDLNLDQALMLANLQVKQVNPDKSIPIEVALAEDMANVAGMCFHADDHLAVATCASNAADMKEELEKLYFLIIIYMNIGALNMRHEFGNCCLETTALYYRYFMEIAGDPLKLTLWQRICEFFA